MSELAGSIFDSIKTRINNPFIFSFSLAWAIMNYKFFMVVFGGGNYSSKFNFIEGELYKDGDKWTRGALYPFLIASFYVFIAPYGKIILRMVGEYFDNLERLSIYAMKKRSVVSQADKEAYFDAMGIELQGVKDELKRSRDVSIKKEHQLIADKDRIERRFQYAALRYFGYSMNVDGTAKESLEICRLLNAVAVSQMIQYEDFSPLAYKKFVDNKFFECLKRLADELANVAFDHDSRVNTFSRDDVKTMSRVDDENLNDLIIFAMAVGVVIEIDHDRGAYCTKHRSLQINIPSNFIQIKNYSNIG